MQHVYELVKKLSDQNTKLDQQVSQFIKALNTKAP